MSLIIENKVIFSELDDNVSMAFTFNDSHNYSKQNEYIYQGEMKDDKMNGFGRLWNNSLNYSGYFKNNKYEGKGILVTNITGDEDKYFVKYYDGNFINGIKSGYGKEIYNNDEYYIGEFQHNLRHGNGTLYNNNGEIKIKSNWDKGSSVNTASITEYYNNGNLKYRGDYDGIHWNGKGVYCNKENNIIFDGVFKSSKFMEGKLISKNGTKIFEGKFKNIDDKISYPFEGTVYDEKENKLLNGTFKLINEDNKNTLSLGILKCSEYYKDGKLYFKGNISMNDDIYKLIFNIDTKSGNHITSDVNYDINLKCKYFDDIDLKIFGYFGNGMIYKENGNVTKIELNENYTGEVTEVDKENNLIKQIGYLEKKIHGKKIKLNENKEKIIEIYNNGDLKSKTIYSKNNILISDIVYSDNPGVIKLKCYFENGDLKYEGNGKQLNNTNITYDGEGKLYYYQNNNLKYEGYFYNGQYEGFGKEFSEQGIKIYEGNFKMNQRHGQGTSYYENSGIQEYIGEWTNNEKHGNGSLYSEEGTLVFTGTFHWDEMQFQ